MIYTNKEINISNYKKLFRHVFLATLSMLVLSSCSSEETKDTSTKANTETKLLFKSGFEDGVYIDTASKNELESYRFIRGKDKETGYSFPINILGTKDSALHYIDHDGFQALKSEIVTVVGHKGTNTKALYSAEYYGTKETELSYKVLNIKEGMKDLYIKYWIKLDAQSLTQPNGWRTFFQWVSKDYDKGTGFRLISFIYTDSDGNPYWHWQGDIDSKNPIWEIDNKVIPVPKNEWFLTEFYWHWSEGSDGRALWKVNGQVVGDYRGATTRNAKAIDFIMLNQIYGNVNPKHQWVDDIEIWNGLK